VTDEVPAEATAEQVETFAMYRRATALLWQDWYKKFTDAENDKPPLLVAKAVLMATTTGSAVMAVDTGITEDDYVTLCRMVYQERCKQNTPN
jgi:hypothetical protein